MVLKSLCQGKQINQTESLLFPVQYRVFFLFLLFFLRTIKLMKVGNKSCCHNECLEVNPAQAAPSYLSSAKVPIDWAADCASVSLPVRTP